MTCVRFGAIEVCMLSCSLCVWYSDTIKGMMLIGEVVDGNTVG